MQRRTYSQGSARVFTQKLIRLFTRKKILLLQVQAKSLCVEVMNISYYKAWFGVIYIFTIFVAILLEPKNTIGGSG